MITQVLNENSTQTFYCLSTDTKPTSADNGSDLYEIDTGKSYKFNEATSAWVEQPSGGGGGADLPATTSMLKGDGSGGAAAAVAGTDYLAPSALSGKMDKLPPLGGNGYILTNEYDYAVGSGKKFGNFDGTSSELTSIPTAAQIRTFVNTAIGAIGSDLSNALNILGGENE